MGTQKRPVPLQHYLYHGEEVYPLLVGGKFNDKAIHDAERREKEKSAVDHTYLSQSFELSLNALPL